MYSNSQYLLIFTVTIFLVPFAAFKCVLTKAQLAALQSCLLVNQSRDGLEYTQHLVLQK